MTCAAETFGERETRLGISALMRDGSQLVSREVQHNARGVATVTPAYVTFS